MQIRQQIFDLLLIQSWSEGGHFVPSHHNNFGHAIVIRWQSAVFQILFLEHVLQTWSVAALRRICIVTTIAITVVNPAPRRLLRIQSEFSVAFAALYIASSKKK